ncbi:8-oxo-dGTP pyrophosphatase MutT (NUDIX family) [Lysinibacillus composti]|uniref:NUDIX domain-containing protein n=1 Tax=Lysinibacillus composti TaxID=720633 RepID=A0A3N9UC35_9BACI|nr:NUDIX hydrolase [Lysinibacillus composti]MBM7609439.1 8-oxo-dGTP pyrophosphatase MutT (NUDIX family) [Lysinibacillus composti]RQW73974.1 NUDIX domain-containing protein [Lysinibacillus composti]
MKLREQIEKYIPYNAQEIKEQEVILRYMDKFDNLLTRDNEFAHFTASAWIVNEERTKVLMIYHNIYQSWSWTGGHADGDGDLLHVALKEVNEETGLTNIKPLSEEIYSIEILGVPAHEKKGKHVATHVHLNVTYLIEANESELTKIKPDENSDIKWWGLEEAIEASTEPEMRVVYRKLNNKLKGF